MKHEERIVMNYIEEKIIKPLNGFAALALLVLLLKLDVQLSYLKLSLT